MPTVALYNIEEDPNEWHNLAGLKTHHPVKRELAKWLPKQTTRPILAITSAFYNTPMAPLSGRACSSAQMIRSRVYDPDCMSDGLCHGMAVLLAPCPEGPAEPDATPGRLAL